MEIKSIKNEKEISYPKSNEISNKIIKRNMPRKWRRIGLVSSALALISENMVFAAEYAGGSGKATINIVEINTAGNDSIQTVGTPVGNICAITSSVLFAISLILIIVNKLKIKKENKKETKIKKGYKIFFIVSAVLLLISIIIKILLDCCI